MMANTQLEHSDFQNISFEGSLEQTSAEVGIEIDQERHEEASPTSEEVNMTLNHMLKANLQYQNVPKKKFIYLDWRSSR